MRYNNNFKALVLLVLLFASVSSATAYSSAFTTSPPDTQNTGEEFTIAGEVETDWFWESDLESIMIQSKTEGSSTWFVEYEKDTGCYGSSCSVSYSGLSHDTAEDVEYRVVASNTRGNTRPVSPSTETVEFIDEVSVTISNIRSTDSSIQEGDDTEFKADISSNLELTAAPVKFYVDGKLIGLTYVNPDAGSSETADLSTNWASLSDKVVTDDDHDITVEVEADGQTFSETKDEAFYLGEAEEDLSVEISNIRSTDSSIQEGDDTEFKADITPSKDVSYLQFSFTSEGEQIGYVQEYNLDGESTVTVSADSDWETLSDSLPADQDHDLTVTARNSDIEVSETVTEAFYLESEEGDSPSVDIKNIRSTDSNIQEDESTELKVDIESDQNINYLDVEFRSDGEVLATEQVTDTIPAYNEETITSEALSWNDLSDQLDTGQEHDVEVVLNGAGIDVSSTESNVFTLAEAEEEGPDVDVTNIRSTDTEIEEGESTEFEFDIESDQDIGYLEVDFRSDGEVLATKQITDTIPANNEETITSESLSWNDLSDQLDTDEDYDLEIVLNGAGIDESFSEEDVFNLLGSEPSQRVQITDLRSTNTHIDEGEDTEFEVELLPNRNIGYLEADFYVDGEEVAENRQSNLENGRSQTISSTVSWEDLENSFDTGQDYDLEVRLNNYAIDLSDTERDAFYLADSDEDEDPDPECQQFSDSDLDPELDGYEALPQEGNDYDATAILNNNGDSDVDGDIEIFVKDSDESISCDHYNDDPDDFIEFADGSVSPSAGSSDSFDFSYTGTPEDDLNFGETYVLMARFDDGDKEYVGSVGSIKWEQTEDESGEPNADFSWSPSQPLEGEEVNFDASDSTDPDNDISEYRWHFGDGSDSETGTTVEHTYTDTGDYDVQLVVEDDEGKTDSITRTVPVGEDPSACSVSVGSLNFEDRIIDRGESTTASISVSNLGDQQAFDIEFRVNGDPLSNEEASINADSQQTFSTVVSPTVDSIVTAEVASDGDACGSEISEERHRELVVIAGRGPDETTSSLEVNVRNEDGRRLSDARVELEGDTDPVRFTDSQGEAFFELSQDTYEMTVSKSGYQTDSRTVEIDSSDQSIDVVLDRSDSETGTLTALVEDDEGNRLENAEVTAENGDDTTMETNSDGRASMTLEQGEYTVTASKSGYGTRFKSLEIEAGEENTELFRLGDDDSQGLEISDVSYPSSVCRGDTLTTEVTIDNNVGFHEFVSLTGTGLGSINALSSFSLEEDESVTKTIRFTNVQGSGNEEFTLTANNQDSDTVTRTVTVESCPVPETQTPSGISMQLSYSQQPNIAVYGDIIKVKGFVDGVRGRTSVDIDVGDETKASVNTRPDGYYETWITADNVGSQTVTARAGEATASRPLRVIPTSTVTGIEAPVSSFEGQTFEVCAQVDSQIEPEVVLERDGEVVTSKKANGRVCFEREAREPGTHNYRIAALTSGSGNTASTNVEVLEMDVETSSFPNQIASVESGSGLIKVDLYNTNENQTTYDLMLEGLPDNWVSQSEKQVILDKGERKTVYFYLTPQEEGSYRPSIVVESRRSEIYDEEISVITGGTTESTRDEGSFLDSFVEGLRGLFSF